MDEWDTRYQSFPKESNPSSSTIRWEMFFFYPNENSLNKKKITQNPNWTRSGIPEIGEQNLRQWDHNMGVSKNGGGPPKWMVYNGKPYEQMGWFGGTTIFGNTHMITVWQWQRQQKNTPDVDGCYTGGAMKSTSGALQLQSVCLEFW